MAPSSGKHVEPDEVVIMDRRGQNGITINVRDPCQNPPAVLSKIDETFGGTSKKLPRATHSQFAQRDCRYIYTSSAY